MLAYDEATEHVARGRRHARRLDARQRVVHEIRLIDVLLHPGLRLRDPGALRTELAELSALARHLGLDDELSGGLTLLARAYHWGWGDIPRARALWNGPRGHLGPIEPKLEPLLEGARCLAYLEMDMDRTRGLFDELGRLHDLADASYPIPVGPRAGAAWRGDADQARRTRAGPSSSPPSAATTGCTFECTARLALLELEIGADAAEPLRAARSPRRQARRGGSERHVRAGDQRARPMDGTYAEPSVPPSTN